MEVARMKLVSTAPSQMALGGYKQNEVLLYNKTTGFVCQDAVKIHVILPRHESKAFVGLPKTERGQRPLAVRIEKGSQGGSMVGGC